MWKVRVRDLRNASQIFGPRKQVFSQLLAKFLAGQQSKISANSKEGIALTRSLTPSLHQPLDANIEFIWRDFTVHDSLPSNSRRFSSARSCNCFTAPSLRPSSWAISRML